MILPESTIDVPIVRLQKLHGPLSDASKRNDFSEFHVASATWRLQSEIPHKSSHLSLVTFRLSPICHFAFAGEWRMEPKEKGGHQNCTNTYCIGTWWCRGAFDEPPAGEKRTALLIARQYSLGILRSYRTTRIRMAATWWPWLQRCRYWRGIPCSWRGVPCSVRSGCLHTYLGRYANQQVQLGLLSSWTFWMQ